MNNIIYKFIKRIFDVLVSLIGILLLIPVSIVIKIINILNGDFNSIFYSQIRIGRYGKEFRLYKFRSMIPHADEELERILNNNKELKLEYEKNKKLKQDPRVTRIGRILRRTNIDELPQVLNVFLNQMSIVGNRPYLPEEVKDMGDYYADIIRVKPGITGLWQTSGRKNRSFEYRCKIESEYYKKMSLSVDVKILLNTVTIVLKGL